MQVELLELWLADVDRLVRRFSALISSVHTRVSQSTHHAFRSGEQMRSVVIIVYSYHYERMTDRNCQYFVEWLMFVLRQALFIGVCLMAALPLKVAQANGLSGLFQAQMNMKPTVLLVQSRRERIIEKLISEGFQNPQFQGRRLFGYVVRACRDGKLYRLSFNPLTVEKRRRVVGSCSDGPVGGSSGLQLSEIRRLLRDEGYYRIRFTDRELPRYAATACQDGNVYDLTVNRRGRVTRRERTGQCRQGGKSSINLAEIRQRLRALGFYRIRPISRDNPPTRIEACKADRLYSIGLSRDGEIESRSYKSRCTNAEVLAASELRKRLQARSYYRIRLVRERTSNVVFDACRLGRRFRLQMAKSGQILSRSSVGWCRLGRERVPDVSSRILEHFPSGSSISAEDCDDYLSALLARTKIRFETNSAEISNRSANLLEEIGHVLNQCRGTTIEVAGHTDSRGTKQLNNRLSRERARSVVRYLVRNDGVARRRLKAVGYGEDQPIARNDTERGRARNRRIEMVVLWSN